MTRIGHHTPENFTPWAGRRANSPDASQRMTYFIGAHRPPWLSQSPVPVFLSLASVVRYAGRGDQWAPIAPDALRCGVYALDSGAYTALTTDNRNHPWHLDPEAFGALVTRVIAENGIPPLFAAIQDVPCEPTVLERTGWTVEQNIEDTVESFLYLSENFPHVPWLPTLQGWTVEQYLACVDAYAAAGVDLTEYEYVGLGSVCRRGEGEVDNVVAVVEALVARGLGSKLHGFGMCIEALRRIGHHLRSADSMAWSKAARSRQLTLDGCEHVGDCRNCLSWALAWRETVLAALRTSYAAAELAAPAPASLDELLAEAVAAPLAPAGEQYALDLAA